MNESLYRRLHAVPVQLSPAKKTSSTPQFTPNHCYDEGLILCIGQLLKILSPSDRLELLLAGVMNLIAANDVNFA